MTGNNPTDRSKLGTKRHILTDKNGIPLSVVISSASTHDINLVTDVVDNAVIAIKTIRRKGGGITTPMFRQRIQICARKTRINQTRVCITYNRTRRKRKTEKDDGEYEQTTAMPSHKKYSPKRWVVERTNSWHNRFRKLFTRY